VTQAQATAALRAAGCVFAEAEARMIIEAAAGRPADIDRMVARRCAGEPLEVVVGFADFAGVRVTVDPGVFVPRARSVALVEVAVAELATVDVDDRLIVDLGCGTGALAAALLARLPVTVFAIDCDPAALACAARNLPTPATVLLGDDLDALPGRLRGRVRAVLANLPYVPTDAIALLPREARDFEPATALDGGPDGLRPFASAITRAREWLHPNGCYLAEVNENQIAAATAIATAAGYRVRSTVDAEDGTAVLRISARE
jgi:release factor glutamine methyltransferase